MCKTTFHNKQNVCQLIVIVICFDFGGLLGLYVDLYSCLRFVLNEKTRQYSTATNTIYICVRFIYRMGAVLYMWLYQCWSSLDLKLFTVAMPTLVPIL